MLPSLIGIIASSGGAVGGDYESISTITVSGSSTANVTFNSIPQTYTHLQVRILARTLTASASEPMYLYNLNNNSGSTGSAVHYLTGNGTSVIAGSLTAQYSAFVGTVPAASSTSNTFGVTILDILDYTNTNKNKTLRSLGGFDANGSGQVEFISNLPVTLPGTAAVSTLTFATSGNMTAGSSFALYGIKG